MGRRRRGVLRVVALRVVGRSRRSRRSLVRGFATQKRREKSDEARPEVSARRRFAEKKRAENTNGGRVRGDAPVRGRRPLGPAAESARVGANETKTRERAVRRPDSHRARRGGARDGGRARARNREGGAGAVFAFAERFAAPRDYLRKQ